MTTELTLREKVLDILASSYESTTLPDDALAQIADLLSATGAPAYIRVADDLRDVWVDPKKIGKDVIITGSEDHLTVQFDCLGAIDPARYLGQFDKRETGE